MRRQHERIGIFSWHVILHCLSLDEYPQLPPTASCDTHVFVKVQNIKAGCTLLARWSEGLRQLW